MGPSLLAKEDKTQGQFQPGGCARGSVPAQPLAEKRKSRSIGMMKDKENANHSSPCRWAESIRKGSARLPPPLTSSAPSPGRACCLPPPPCSQPHWPGACILSILVNAAASLHPCTAWGPQPLSLLASAWALSCLLSLLVAPPLQCSGQGGLGVEGTGVGRGRQWQTRVTPGLEQKPPFTWENVSPTDTMLHDNSFSFCGADVFNISSLSPAHSRAALERLAPGTDWVWRPRLPCGARRSALHVSMLPSAGRRRHPHRLGAAA